MIRRLRRRHLIVVPMVGLVSGAVLLTGLRERARMAPPPVSDLAVLDGSDGPPVGSLIFSKVLSPDSLLDIALWSRTANSDSVFVGLRARGALPYPSGQVYLRPPDTATEEATRLGPLTGERWAWFMLPDGIMPDGMVVIYSPGFGTFTDSGPLPPLARAGLGDR